MAISFIRWLIFIPVSLFLAYSFKELLFIIYEPEGFFATLFIWSLTSSIFMMTTVYLVPSKKYSVIKYSYLAVLFYSFIFILTQLAAWEHNGFFDVIYLSIYVGCITGTTFIYFLLKNKLSKDEVSNSEMDIILNKPSHDLFDLLPPSEQDNLRKQAVQQLESEKAKNHYKDYEVSEESIIKRACLIFEKKEKDEEPLQLTKGMKAYLKLQILREAKKNPEFEKMLTEKMNKALEQREINQNSQNQFNR